MPAQAGSQAGTETKVQGTMSAVLHTVPCAVCRAAKQSKMKYDTSSSDKHVAGETAAQIQVVAEGGLATP